MKLQKIPNQRISGKLEPLNLARVDSIVLHHMAHETADVKTVECWHVDGNGWNAIGYNYWIAFDGTVYEGRGLHVGAGVANHNSHIISIGFQGDYSKDVAMPDEQFNAGVELIEWLMGKLSSKKQPLSQTSGLTAPLTQGSQSGMIKGHRDFGGSVCPGNYFPFEEMKKLRKRSVSAMIYNYIDENMPEWARPYVQKAVAEGIIKGNEHGELQLTDDKIWTLVVIMRATGVMK